MDEDAHPGCRSSAEIGARTSNCYPFAAQLAPESVRPHGRLRPMTGDALSTLSRTTDIVRDGEADDAALQAMSWRCATPPSPTISSGVTSSSSMRLTRMTTDEDDEDYGR